MTSTLKDNSTRASIYKAFPQGDLSPTIPAQSTSSSQDELGGLLAGVGPTLSDLSFMGLLRSLME